MKRLLIAILIVIGLPQLCFGVAATMYVMPVGAGDFSGSSWANAMGYTQWETDVEGAAEAGDIYYVAGGQYTLTSDLVTALDGTAATPITIIGVNSGTSAEPPTVADWATGDNRPLITDTTNNWDFNVDDFWIVRNIRMEGSDTNCILIGGNSIVENCKITNDSATSARNALYCDSTAGKVINSELISTNGNGINLVGASSFAAYNYIHDCSTGVVVANATQTYAHNIIDTCSTAGIVLNATRDYIYLLNNTIYNCPLGITSTDSESCVLVHNIINDCTTKGATFGAEAKNNFVEWNNWEGNTGGDVTNLTKGVYDLAVDPLFTDAAGGDFSLQFGSGVLNTGLNLLGSTQ